MSKYIDPKGPDKLVLSPYAHMSVSRTLMPKVTPVVDTAIYAAGDVFFDTVEVPKAFDLPGGSGMINGLTILDKGDQTAAAMTIYVFDANVSLGTVNGAPNISDPSMLSCLGTIPVASTDWVDAGGAKIATVRNIQLPVKVATGTSLWIAATCAGTPTQGAATDVQVTLGIKQQ